VRTNRLGRDLYPPAEIAGLDTGRLIPRPADRRQETEPAQQRHRVGPLATGIRPDDRTLAGPTPSDDREGTYHRRLTRTVNARYGEALKVWEARILDYVGHRDEHIVEMAKKLDQLHRRGVDAQQVLNLAAARKPLPTDHATAALAYRVRELATPKRLRLPGRVSTETLERAPQQPLGPSPGL